MQHSVTFSIRNISAKFGIDNSPQFLDVGQNADVSISDFRVFGQFPIKENCHNFRTSDDFDIKGEPVTKLGKKNKTTSKKLTLTSCRKNVTQLSFFGFLANLDPSWDWTPGTESANVMFSEIVASFLTKTEDRTKKPLT